MSISSVFINLLFLFFGISQLLHLMGHLRPLFPLLCVFVKQTLQFLEQINGKNVHPVYHVVIQTHDPQIVSLIP